MVPGKDSNYQLKLLTCTILFENKNLDTNSYTNALCQLGRGSMVECQTLLTRKDGAFWVGR
jgi:hypothetical protein